MNNNWIFKTTKELREEAMKALQKAKELETIKKQRNEKTNNENF